MRYTYLFTQVSRFEDGDLVPVTDKPYEFVFTFGKKIETFMGESSDNTMIITKDKWKEHPAKNEEILQTVCFSTSSNQGFRRPLVMTKDAEHREGKYSYQLVYSNEIKEGGYLSEDLRILTKTFVKGVYAVNDETLPKSWHSLEDVKVKYLMSYIKSYVYIQLLQDKDHRGQIRAEDFLKKVLEIFFSLIPDKVIDRFDKGLAAHDQIRERLEGVPENDIATRKAVLKSHGYFDSIDDYKLFVNLRKYILSVKNGFNHLIWVMYRSKIGMVKLKSVRAQLGAMFGFVSKVQEDCKPKDKQKILEAISSKDCLDTVKGFLSTISRHFDVKNMNKSQRAALCYKFQEECHHIYLNNRYKCYSDIKKKVRSLHQEEFRDLCLRYWGIEEKSTLRLNKCKHLMVEFGGFLKDTQVWEPMRKLPQFPK